MSKPLLLYVLLAYDTQSAEGSDEVCFDLEVDTDFNRLKDKADEYIGSAKGMHSVSMEVKIYSTDDIAGMKVHYGDMMGYDTSVQFHDGATTECVYHEVVDSEFDEDEDDEEDDDDEDDEDSANEDHFSAEEEANLATIKIDLVADRESAVAKSIIRGIERFGYEHYWATHRLHTQTTHADDNSIKAVELTGAPENLKWWLRDIYRIDDAEELYAALLTA